MLIEVRVKTKSSRVSINRLDDNKYQAALTSPAHDDLANKELIDLVSKYFKIAKSLITIKSGLHSKTKLLRVDQKIRLS